MNKGIRAALMCAAAVAVPLMTHAQDACEFVQVNLGDDTQGAARGLNNWGQVVGVFGTNEPPYLQRPFVWQDGTTTELEPLEPGRSAGAMAINDLRRIVGWSDSAQGERPVTWIGDAVAELSADEQAIATAINTRGEIAGHTLSGKCLFWANARSTPVAFAPLGGSSCYTYAISETGDVVGEANAPDRAFHAFTWRGGAVTDARPDASYLYSRLVDVNLAGTFVGQVSTNDGPAPLVRTRTGATRVLPIVGSAEAVNLWGTIAVLDFSIEREDSHLLLADRFGHFRDKGTLGGEVFSGDLMMNDRFQLAWNPYRPDGMGLLPPYFCQLR